MTKAIKKTNSGCLKTVALFLVSFLTILFGGLALQKWAITNARNQVDENGVNLKAIVFQKNSNSKGKTTWFKFTYKGKECISSDAERDLYYEFSMTIRYLE